MSDQVERLRKAAAFVAKHTGAENAQWIYDAADEIESLRERLAETKEEYEDHAGFLWATETKLHAAEAAVNASIEECAKIAEFFNDGAHIAHDMRHGRFPKRSSTNDAIAEAIREKMTSTPRMT